MLLRHEKTSHVLECLGTVIFPAPQDIHINMLPFVLGDPDSLPDEYRQYWPLVQACHIEKAEEGSIGYLSLMESFVQTGHTQRRHGVHTDGHGSSAWGWGRGASVTGERMRGLYMASTTQGQCRAWNCAVEAPGEQGDCEALRTKLERVPYVVMEANTLYWMTDACPHESLPAITDGYRQWFRVVTHAVDVWFAWHSTANRLGVLPAGRIIHANKFAKDQERVRPC